MNDSSSRNSNNSDYSNNIEIRARIVIICSLLQGLGAVGFRMSWGLGFRV